MLSVLIYPESGRNRAACQLSAVVRYVVVLVPFSTDRSVGIARTHGARVFQRRFVDFGSQRNYALEKVCSKQVGFPIIRGRTFQ